METLAPSVRDRCNALRNEIKAVAARVGDLKQSLGAGRWAHPEAGAVPDVGEMLANVTISYRHLEDAAMRLGKTIQAWDGGNSIYDSKGDTVSSSPRAPGPSSL